MSLTANRYKAIFYFAKFVPVQYYKKTLSMLGLNFLQLYCALRGFSLGSVETSESDSIRDKIFQ